MEKVEDTSEELNATQLDDNVSKKRTAKEINVSPGDEGRSKSYRVRFHEMKDVVLELERKIQNYVESEKISNNKLERVERELEQIRSSRNSTKYLNIELEEKLEASTEQYSQLLDENRRISEEKLEIIAKVKSLTEENDRLANELLSAKNLFDDLNDKNSKVLLEFERMNQKLQEAEVGLKKFESMAAQMVDKLNIEQAKNANLEEKLFRGPVEVSIGEQEILQSFEVAQSHAIFGLSEALETVCIENSSAIELWQVPLQLLFWTQRTVSRILEDAMVPEYFVRLESPELSQGLRTARRLFRLSLLRNRALYDFFQSRCYHALESDFSQLWRGASTGEPKGRLPELVSLISQKEQTIGFLKGAFDLCWKLAMHGEESMLALSDLRTISSVEKGELDWKVKDFEDFTPEESESLRLYAIDHKKHVLIIWPFLVRACGDDPPALVRRAVGYKCLASHLNPSA